jgi:hypothetical protein
MKSWSFHDVPIYDDPSDSRRLAMFEARRDHRSGGLVGGLGLLVIVAVGAWMMHVCF